MQRAFRPLEFRLPRRRSRFRRKLHHKRVHLRIVLLNLSQMRIHKFHGRELALTDTLDHGGQRQAMRHVLEYRSRSPRIVFVTPLRWDEARDCVRRNVAGQPALEFVELAQGPGRVLARDVFTDRAYPPMPRSMRDGFALRASELPGRFHLKGEVRAGEPALQDVAPGECVEIMTGAPVPNGADAVVMVEHVGRDGDFIVADRTLSPGDNINPRGCEACAGERVLDSGLRLDYGHLAVLASVGVFQAPVYRKPSVSIIATGDELVEPGETPKEFQIRNSNSHTLAAQVSRAGGEVVYATRALDTEEALRAALDRALQTDLILLSGGVSAGKYDLVEPVLAEYGAEFFFTRVLIQPGQPAVFGKVGGKVFFGLPGNPTSTMVTFELFARLALELIGGCRNPALPIYHAPLTRPFRHKTGLTRFLPALLDAEGGVTPVAWKGSGDVFAVGRANAFLVADQNREAWAAGDWIRILPR